MREKDVMNHEKQRYHIENPLVREMFTDDITLFIRIHGQ